MLVRLRRYFDVRAGEGLPVLLASLYVATVVAAFLLAKPLRNSLYLPEYGPFALAYVYVAVPVVLSVSYRCTPRLLAAWVLAGPPSTTLVCFAFTVVGFWWAFRSERFELLPAVFYVWVNCFG